ncbi:MAG: aminomethyltransferase family protein [Planctomycetota bacterium]
MTQNPLEHLHLQAGAQLSSDQPRVPLRFGTDLEKEYWRVARGAGLFDMSHRGRFQLAGKDAIDWMNSLVTNDVKALRPGTGVSAVLTTPKGRVIDVLTLLLSNELFLVDTHASRRGVVVSWMQRYLIREDVRISDVTEDTCELWLRGPRVARVIEALGGPDPESLPALGHCRVAVADAAVYFIKHVDALGLGFDFILRAEDAPRVYSQILAAGAPYDLARAGLESYETLRLEAGMPEVGSELSEDVNPLEAGLFGAVSFKKGCYVGQEVVARLNTYQKVMRQVTGFVLPEGAAASANDAVLIDGKEIGRISSCGHSFKLGVPIALGYVKSTYAEAGRRVTIQAARGPVDARMATLPFALAAKE